MHAAARNANGPVTGQLVAGTLVVLAMSFLLQIFIKRRRRRVSSYEGEFPRGPSAWPIVGHLPLLRTAPHRVLADLYLKQGYDPIIGLRLGSQPVVVVSNVALAKELLLMHDKTFANRPPYQFADALFYGYNTAVILSSYNPHCTRLRKIYSLELFTAKRLRQLEHIRQDEVRGLLHNLLKVSAGGAQPVNVGKLLREMTSNTTARLLQSKTLSDVAPELPDIIHKFEREAIPLLGDFFPWLTCFNVRRKRSMKHLHNRFDKIVDFILLKRREVMARSPPHELPHDFLQVLLSKETTGNEEELLTIQEIKGIMLDIFAGGIHTSAATLEWAIAELLRNPACMHKLRDEIDAVMGKGVEELVRDEDVPKLPYLENTVKEVLRLHPVLPLLLPRMSSEACKVGKYTLPRKTQAFVNVWAICRDPLVWENPEAFWPERFEGKDMDVKGLHYELLPFGAGRRACPGMRLGLSVVQVTLANLVKTLNWELPHGHTPSAIDMGEDGGISNSKAKPMLAIPTPRIP